MNYIEVYNRITLNRKDLPKETYGEVHHIWPKSLGGGNKSENMVRLSAKEHYIAHHLLTKIFPDCREMATAFGMMCGRIGAKGVYVSPRVFALARENFAKAQRGRKVSAATLAKMRESQKGLQRGENHPMFGKHHSAESRQKIREARLGKKASVETKQKLSATHKGLYSGSNHPFYGKHHRAETCAKMSAAMSGENNPFFGEHHSAEVRAKISAAHRGKTISEEARAKMSAANRGSNNGRYDNTQYVFQHPEHGTRVCAPYELRTKFSLDSSDVSKLVRGLKHTCKGWRMLEKIKEEIKTNE